MFIFNLNQRLLVILSFFSKTMKMMHDYWPFKICFVARKYICMFGSAPLDWNVCTYNASTVKNKNKCFKYKIWNYLFKTKQKHIYLLCDVLGHDFLSAMYRIFIYLNFVCKLVDTSTNCIGGLYVVFFMQVFLN
jgi:hypothetical protein